MPQHPWIVALISTDYDLQDERKAIISFLHQYGFSISVFDEPDYPVQEDVHSHTNCILALKRADLAIVLVNERYGGDFYLDKTRSITQAEYESLEIPTICLVNKRTWDIRHLFRQQQRKSGLSEEEYIALGQYDAGGINLNVFGFISRIQNAYSVNGRSNWINFWTDIEDLKSKLPKLMQSRSVTLIHKIVDGQIKEINNRRTSTGLSMPLGDVFSKGFYIEQEFDLLSGQIGESEPLPKVICDNLANKESCLVLGEAGAGKTTLMAKCFLQMVELTKDNPFCIPAYIWLKGMGIESTFTIQEYLNNGCNEYLHKQCYPFFNLDELTFYFFIDGFDELAENISSNDLRNLCSKEIFKAPLMLTSRKQFFDHYHSTELTSKFSLSFRLKDWSQSTAERYIKQFCKIQRKGSDFVKRIYSLLLSNPDLQDILKNPLLITILLYVIDFHNMEIPETIRSRTQLFDECISCLAQREIENKFSAALPEKHKLVITWALLAWFIYESRLEGKDPIHISDALSNINSILFETPIEWPLTIYEVIFDMKGEYVHGAIHEQFLEYLVAYALVYACLNRSAPYPEFLKYVMRPEINRYFRGIYALKSKEDQQLIFNNIRDLYWQCMGYTDTDNILKRVHAVYHLSRMNLPNSSKELDRIFLAEKERAVLLSLYFGVIKKGNLLRERELYNFINSDGEYSNSNRGYHLAYYGSSSTPNLQYSDNPLLSWDGPLRAFLRHFSSSDIEHYYLRRIDLITMRQFMECRQKQEPLNDEILSEIEKWLSHTPPAANSDYQRLVVEEFTRVKETYLKYS